VGTFVKKGGFGENTPFIRALRRPRVPWPPSLGSDLPRAVYSIGSVRPYVVENGHCARWACRLDGPEVSAGAHARLVSS
jgi:hypothetical protein